MQLRIILLGGMTMTIGNVIAEKRKDLNMTQEALARKLGVTNQAVSKWELDQACPDIQLLPLLADSFGISIDALFGRGTAVPGKELPWEDDDTLRAVLYRGHTLLKSEADAKNITFTLRGDALNVVSAFSVCCGNVEGNIEAGTCVSCGNVEGNIDAGTHVSCGNVEGDIDAGANVNCGNVTGDVDAGANIRCGSIGGSADAGGAIVVER